MTDHSSSKSSLTLGGKAAWYALALIGLSQAVSMMDRQILSILMPRIKADLQVGDAEMGLLYGTVFGLFYAIFSLPLGRLADGWNRTKQLGLSVLGWTGMTALGGAANSFSVLAISRLGVGIGEASVQPAGFSILFDVFPKHKRGMVSAVMAAAVALGMGSALWLGGTVADYWDQAYALIDAPLGLKGWQAAFIAASIPGFILGILLLKMKEPPRGLADGITHKEDPHPFRESLITLTSILPVLAWFNFARLKVSKRDWLINIAGGSFFIVLAIVLIDWSNGLREANAIALSIGSLNLTGNTLQWSLVSFGSYVVLSWLQSLKYRDRSAFTLIAHSKSMTLLVMAVALQNILNYGVMAWTPVYLMKTFNQSPTEVGLVFGAIVAGVGVIGPMISGPVSDWINQRVAAGRIYVTLVSLITSSVLVIATFNAQSITAFYAWFVLFSFTLTMWLPPLYACLMDLVLPRMRGIVMSYYILAITIFGLGIGPYAVGLISDTNGGNLGEAILNIYMISPVIIILVALLIKLFPSDEKKVLVQAKKEQ